MPLAGECRQRGTGSHYSNIDLEMLGLVIEKATGQGLPLPHRLMRGRLLSPAMLDSVRTRSFWSGGDMPACRGQGLRAQRLTYGAPAGTMARDPPN